MQRRGINKRLSFAEAENGQKDRNKEEVEEEREPATEKGINKSGEGERAERKKEREARREGEGEERARQHRQWVQLSSPLSLCSTNVPIYYFRGIRSSFRIESFYFRRVQKSSQQPGRCPRVSLSVGPLLSNYNTDLRTRQKWNKEREREREG